MKSKKFLQRRLPIFMLWRDCESLSCTRLPILQFSFSFLENHWWRMSRTMCLISSLMTSTKCFFFVCFVWFKEQYLDAIHFFSGIFITTDWGLSQKDFSKIFNHLEDCKFLTSHTCFAAPFQVIRLLQIVWIKVHSHNHIFSLCFGGKALARAKAKVLETNLI